ncbi:hypothetical protein S101468_01383 [Acetobacter pasteurianus subsp. pasteurianus]|uniref:Uncharacterized protein n=1 Tax=Acetobacter pasteurianus subsp. pasteurianus TaxID=481145 RepID=A0AAC9STP0_ACEPA|nr:hypothetical protein [Acetobacter pasteurianus]ASC05641.1 hypothetical protein S101468_01383 [Acetobacter pasteurianus subsp. pasteurianus]
MNHNQSSTSKLSPCQPESFRAFKAELRVRWQMSAFRMAFMPPRMMPDVPDLRCQTEGIANPTLLFRSVRDGESKSSRLIWKRYASWRAFFRHVQILGFPALYLRGH